MGTIIVITSVILVLLGISNIILNEEKSKNEKLREAMKSKWSVLLLMAIISTGLLTICIVILPIILWLCATIVPAIAILFILQFILWAVW